MDPIATINAHVPSLSDEDIEAIYQRAAAIDQAADLAIRTCSCGQRIDGFYEYVDHLISIFEKEA